MMYWAYVSMYTYTYSYAIYAMIFSMLTMLLSMFEKAPKILNHNGERADASNLAQVFYFYSHFGEWNFKNHRSCVSQAST